MSRCAFSFDECDDSTHPDPWPRGLRAARPCAYRRCIAVLCLCLGACASQPDYSGFAGKHRCESIFIYSVCIADRDASGTVDYVYFGDDLQVFMFDPEQEAELRVRHRFHRCAVAMSDDTRELSSQLLYGEDLGLSQRLAIKGRLIRSYRAAQPAVDACQGREGSTPSGTDDVEDPFVIGEDWDEDWNDEDGKQF
ncbi:MAG: hypothetical protein V2I82_07260 [Halieaceae bacterium]|nr:hypothetical protein [Halieaceae bacterium]